jgi:hypothetical protein
MTALFNEKASVKALNNNPRINPWITCSFFMNNTIKYTLPQHKINILQL